MSPELITLGVSTLSAFIFKNHAEKRKSEAHQMDLALRALSGKTEAWDAAAKRDGEVGKFVRRFIAFSAMVLLFMSYFAALTEMPTVVEVVDQKRSWLFGLIGGKSVTHFVEVTGFFFPQEVRLMVNAVVGFYFGQGAAK